MFQMTSFFVLCDGESIFFLQNLKLSLIYGATGVHDDNLSNWSVYMNIIYKQFALNVYNNRIYSTSKAHEFDIWTNQKKILLKKKGIFCQICHHHNFRSPQHCVQMISEAMNKIYGSAIRAYVLSLIKDVKYVGIRVLSV